MSEKELKVPQRGKVKDHKLMPIEIEQEMSTTQKIIAHFENGFYLDDVALKRYQKLERVFNAVFNYKTKAQCVRVVIMNLKCSRQEAYVLLEEVQEVFGNFFEVNKSAKRYLQELRLDHLYGKALENKDDELALEVIKEKNKLFDLYNPEEDYTGNAHRELPIVKRSSDPRILQEMYIDEEE